MKLTFIQSIYLRYKQKCYENKKYIYGAIASTALLGSLFGVLAYASEDHGEETPSGASSEEVILRKVGDTDPDAISKEGLGSFFGEITSKDVSSVHPPREGVLSSWNVSIGDYVGLGQVLGYVTVTGISPEQQALLVEQQTNAYKAQLDAQTAESIAVESETIFNKVIENFRSLTNKQKSAYTNNSGTSSSAYLTEIATLQARQASLENKLQDFGNTVIVTISPLVSNPEQSPFNQGYVDTSLKFEVGTKDSNMRNTYLSLIKAYASKTLRRTLTEQDIRDFLNRTNQITEASSQGGNLDVTTITASVKDLQNDLRELGTELDAATLAKVAKEREYSQLDIELSKNITTLDNDLALKKLDQTTFKKKAENEARAAQLLAEKLSQTAGGVIPILSPRSGIVASIDKNIGDYITMSDRLGYVSVSSPTKLVRFTIPPSWKEIKNGDTLSVVWRPDFLPRSARIVGISPMINEKGGYQAEAILAKNTEYPVGASVSLIPENSRSGVFINRKAVQFGSSTIPFIWTVTGTSTITKQEVKPGRQLGEYVEVISGLHRGDSYLVINDEHVEIHEGDSLDEFIKESEPAHESEEDEHGH